jgi:hypothetical protein
LLPCFNTLLYPGEFVLQPNEFWIFLNSNKAIHQKTKKSMNNYEKGLKLEIVGGFLVDLGGKFSS